MCDAKKSDDKETKTPPAEPKKPEMRVILEGADEAKDKGQKEAKDKGQKEDNKK